MTKKCKYCGEDFEPKHLLEKYCSDECRSKYYTKYHREYHKHCQKVPNKHYPKPSREVLNLRARIYYRFRKKRPKYPCYRIKAENVTLIPDEWCLNCYSEKCRFDYD